MAVQDVDNQLKLDTKAQTDFACNVLRVMRYVMNRIKIEQRKSWKTDDLLELMDALISEITQGITEEDKIRQISINQGKAAFTAGTPRTKNPYDKTSKEFTWWDTGWRDAARGPKTIAATSAIDRFKKPQKEDSQPKRRYKVQINQRSEISEWSDTFHMYVQQGGGTLFEDFDEATTVANRLKLEGIGTVSIIIVE